jgi:hypothetical protein
MSSPDDRRRSPRVDLVGQLQGELVSMDVPVAVREISLGGMSIETTTPFDKETRLAFMLTLGDGAAVFVVGRVAYCRQVDRDGTPAFVSGIQFFDDEESGQGHVGNLVRKVR